MPATSAVDLQGRGRHRRRRARRLVPAPPGETIALVGESRLGQVGDRAHGDAAPDQARDDQPEVARSPLAARTSSRCRDRDMRKLRGNDISMIFQEPMSSLNPVYTIGQQICEILHLHNRMSARRGDGAGRGAARGSADPRARGAAQAVSAPAVGRPAPARDDRHGARQPPRRADRRRADDRARRHRAGPDPQPHQGPQGQVRHGGDPHHPRPDRRPASSPTTST